MRPRAFSSFSILIMSSERIVRCSASSRPNPRSLKTFPLERVILPLAFSMAFSPPMLQQLPISRSRQLDVGTGGLPGALLEGVQYVDALEEPGDVADPVFRFGVDSYLLDTRPYAGHRLPVVGLQPLLDTKELEASYPPRRPGKPLMSRRDDPSHRRRLVIRPTIQVPVYSRQGVGWTASPNKELKQTKPAQLSELRSLSPVLGGPCGVR